MTAAGISDGKLFRDSLKGYNRQDVHDFIEKLNRDHAESENALRINSERILRQKSELERVISVLKENNNSLTDENKILSEKIADFDQQSADIARLEELEDEVVHLREELRQKVLQLDELQTKAKQTPISLDGQTGLVIRMDNNNGTGRFDEAFKMIGSFLQLANETAKTTVSEAKEKAEDIVRKAYEEKEAYIKERQEKVTELNRQYAELCVRSSGIIKELIQLHSSVDGQIKDSGMLFGGENNGAV